MDWLGVAVRARTGCVYYAPAVLSPYRRVREAGVGRKKTRKYRVNDKEFLAISKKGEWVKFKPLGSGIQQGVHYFQDKPFDHIDIYDSQKETKSKLQPAEFAKSSIPLDASDQVVSVSGAISSFVAPLAGSISVITTVASGAVWGVKADAPGYAVFYNIYRWKDEK